MARAVLRHSVGVLAPWLRAGIPILGSEPSCTAVVAAATANVRHLEWFHDHVRIAGMFFDGVAQPQPGGVLVPDLARPGHGLEFRDEAASPYRIG